MQRKINNPPRYLVSVNTDNGYLFPLCIKKGGSDIQEFITSYRERTGCWYANFIIEPI